MKTCSVEDCEKGGKIVRGMCDMHYRRWQRHGDPLVTLTYATPEEAFLARTEPLLWSGCVVWTGATNRKGYGVLGVNGRTVMAHRYAWERERGRIPDGAVLDHTCWERACCNVDHLRLATPAQNTQNRSGAMPGRGLPRGVYREGRRYKAVVQSGGQYHRLGIFDTPEEASQAAQTKRALLFGEYAGGA